MTSTEMLALLRIYQNDPSGGSYIDAQNYVLLTSAQDLLISKALSKQFEMRKVDNPYFELAVLKAVSKLVSITTTTASTYALSTVTDYMRMNTLEMVNTSPARNLQVGFTDYGDFIKNKGNTYSGHSYSSTTKKGNAIFAETNGVLYSSFAPSSFPSTDYDAITINYYFKPPAIASGQAPTLEEYTHETIVKMAFALGLNKDDQVQRQAMLEQSATQEFLNFN